MGTYHRALAAGLERDAALAATTRRYSELMHKGDPVHTWPVGIAEEEVSAAGRVPGR